MLELENELAQGISGNSGEKEKQREKKSDLLWFPLRKS